MIDLGLVHREFPEIKEAARLGRGGFKEVFSGRHESDGLVVLKLILPGKQDTDQLAREVDACSSVDCDRVPRVYAHGQVDTELGALLWIREQRIVGQSLDDVLRQAPLSDRECMRMSLHVGGALAAAEQVNIVHRDVKPGNIMKDESGYWLLDFGIARHLDLESLTSTKAMWGKGTPGYAPPEQWRNQKPDIDGRADQFALAVTICECLTGEHPFRQAGGDQLDTLARSETIPLPRVDRHMSCANAEAFAKLVEVMGHKRRDQRVRTFADAYAWLCDLCIAEGVD